MPRYTGTTSDASIPTGVQPCFGDVGTGGGQGSCTAALVNEGHDQVMEFADGALELFAAALAYSDDTTAPTVALTGPSSGAGSVRVTFDADDATDVYYTTDGSTPTLASTAWAPARRRWTARPAEAHPDHDREVDRHRREGQRVGSPVADDHGELMNGGERAMRTP